jgi:UPF0755 protein
MRITGNDNNIKSGEYLFKGKLAPIDVMNSLVKGNFYYRKITIPECFTIKQVTQILNDNKYLVGNINKAPEEGSIFPDTYYFQRDEKKIDIVKRMQKKMNIVVEEIWEHNNNLFKSKQELVILASLVNAETKKNKEKHVVSSVFHNRMIKNMRLQSDPTVLYAKNLNKTIISKKIFKKDLRTDNPWNTYTRKGLPSTPICNPGAISLKAAMKPLKTNFLYFVSDGDGGHMFSSNLKKHKQNIKIWKKIIKNDKI